MIAELGLDEKRSVRHLSISTRSSLSRAQRAFGQKIFTRLPESRVGSM